MPGISAHIHSPRSLCGDGPVRASPETRTNLESRSGATSGMWASRGERGYARKMKTRRQDAWGVDDDEKLAELVLRHIRDGSTQLAAFEESAELLGRTAAACGYRWNACVRKRFADAIDKAKAKRKEKREELKSVQADAIGEVGRSEPLTWNAVLRFLRQCRHDYGVLQSRVHALEHDVEAGRFELDRLRRDKQELTRQLRRLSEEHLVISEDYRTLLAIVDRARLRRSGRVPEEVPKESDTDPLAAKDAAKSGHT